MNAPRSDSWYAGLTEEQLWEMYSTAKKFGSAWYKTIEWANSKWKLELKTSKTAYYRWKDWMYDQDSGTREHFAALTSRSVEEQAAAARILDKSLTDGIKSLAAQALFVADDPVKGKALAETFSKFATAALEGEKLKLAAAAQQVAAAKGNALFYGGALLDAKFVRETARAAGAHIYCDSDDNLYAGNGFVVIHAISPGAKTIHLPAPADVTDLFTGELLGRNVTEVSFAMDSFQTRVLITGNADEHHAAFGK